ncbi:MAG: site-2 protease family protein [Actinomycetota bacterium]
MLIQYLIAGRYLTFMAVAVTLLTAIALHEFGHAAAATAQGDRGPKLAGRLTLNPLVHLDPVGTFMLFLSPFGWGKPVQFTPRSLRNPRAGVTIVALAGPAMNVLLAILGAFALAVFRPEGFGNVLGLEMVRWNAMLAVFNLIPIPPLDGSRILTVLLPPNRQHVLFFLDKWGILLLLGIVFLFREPLAAVINLVGVSILRMFGLDYLTAPGGIF